LTNAAKFFPPKSARFLATLCLPKSLHFRGSGLTVDISTKEIKSGIKELKWSYTVEPCA
jgi:hypothetical protein